MFVPELWQTHNEYKTLVNGYWKSNKSQISNLYAKEHQVLLDLNLDVLPDYISQFYSTTGHPAKKPASLYGFGMFFKTPFLLPFLWAVPAQKNCLRSAPIMTT